MDSEEKKICAICGVLFDKPDESSPFAEAGEWLAKESWGDSGTVCSSCLESRGLLAMMYLHEKNR
jgi:hypothetical protein